MSAALIAAALILAACNGSDSASSAASATSQAASIATAITQVGTHRANLGSADLNRSMLTLTMSVKGIGQADVTCYEAIAVPAFGDGFNSLSVFDLVVW